MGNENNTEYLVREHHIGTGYRSNWQAVRAADAEQAMRVYISARYDGDCPAMVSIEVEDDT